jgi:hypothetical protein
MEKDIDQRLSRLEATVEGLATNVDSIANSVRVIMTGRPTNWGWIISAASLAIVTLNKDVTWKQEKTMS